MTGVCVECGEEVPVPSTRGSRLAHYRCPRCGGGLRGKPPGKGKLVPCVVCGQRRHSKGQHIRYPEFPFTLKPGGYEAQRLYRWREQGGKDVWGNKLRKPYE